MTPWRAPNPTVKGRFPLNGRSRRQNTRVSDAAVRRAKRLYERASAAARNGLVHGPYLTAQPVCSVTLARGGRCVKVRRKCTRATRRPYQTPRGCVREFSRKSRTRLQQFLCALPVDHVGRGMLFVTLTYPGAYPGAWGVWKRQLDTWIKRLRRRLPGCGGVWKLEPQKRGAPHFHLLLVGVPFLAREWLSRSWYEVVGSGDKRHLAAGTNVELARSHRGVVAYASKYVAKQERLPVEWDAGVGRWWGVFGRRELAVTYERWGLTQVGFYAIVRAVRSIIDRRQERGIRAPPGWGSAGCWLILSDREARRLVSGAIANAHDAEPYGTIVRYGAAQDSS